MITIAPAHLREVSFVAAHMREADRREIWCQWPGEDAAALAWATTRSSPGQCWAALENGSPIAAFGASEQHPGLWQAWAFGTARMRRAVPAISRHITGCVHPALAARGANRIEARSIAGHDLAHRWLESLGARRECLLARYGRNGEDFVLYAWVAGRDRPPGRAVLGEVRRCSEVPLASAPPDAGSQAGMTVPPDP